MDIVWSAALAGLAIKLLTGARLIVDTGDAIHELAKSRRLGIIATAATGVLEEVALRSADLVVVRGRYHMLHLQHRGFRSVTHVPDCPDSRVVTQRPTAEVLRQLRHELGLDNVLSVGLVGSLVRTRASGVTYGWDLVEALALLPNSPVRGVVVGDGNGLGPLRERARHLGVHNRIAWVGRIPPESLGTYLYVMDVCLSTQTDNLAGWVRTTGKLPIYLACERFVLATDVGEASWVLPPEMVLSFHGRFDPEYPSRLALRLSDLAADLGHLDMAKIGPALVARHFDPARLKRRLSRVLNMVLEKDGSCVSMNQ